MSKHTTVSLPKGMFQKLDEIARNDANYNSASDVARDAIRQFLRRYEWMQRAKEVSYHGKKGR